jgi:outer membrane protein assembly factor BamB
MYASSNGAQSWVTRYNGPGNGEDKPVSIKVASDGSVYVTGRSKGTGTGFDYATVKYNSSGVQQWVQRYNGTGNGDDYPVGLVISSSGNVRVGYSYEADQL